VLALVLIGWVAWRLYQIVPENDENRKELISLKTDYFQITAFVQSNVGELEGIVSNYFQTKDAAQLELFQTRCGEFKKWLENENVRWKPLSAPIVLPWHIPRIGQTNQLTRIQTQMLPLIASIETALRNYKNAASYLMNNAGKITLSDQPTQQGFFIAGNWLGSSIQSSLSNETAKMNNSGLIQGAGKITGDQYRNHSGQRCESADLRRGFSSSEPGVFAVE